MEIVDANGEVSDVITTPDQPQFNDQGQLYVEHDNQIYYLGRAVGIPSDKDSAYGKEALNNIDNWGLIPYQSESQYFQQPFQAPPSPLETLGRWLRNLLY